jgi:hypothetical protein
VIVKAAEVAPEGTVVVSGTWAAALSVDNVTTAPAAGAGPLSVTVPLTVLPLTTLGEARVRPVSASVAVEAGPTVAVGSTAAYLRTRTVSKLNVVPNSP